MKVICRFNRTRVAVGRGHDLHLLVRLRAPEPPGAAKRVPLCLLPVVDVSASMAGRKLESVCQALHRLIEHLVPGDHVGLVTFSSDARTASPLVELTEARREELRRAINALAVRSNTNLAGGLIHGLDMLHGASIPPGMRTRLLVLTDGLANQGAAITYDEILRLVRPRLSSVTLSAFGYGDDCDHALLTELAAAGSGSYAYIRSEDEVLRAFARELGGLVSTYAADVQLRVTPIAGAPIEEHLGDLLYHGERGFVVPVAAPLHRQIERVALCSVEVEWRDANGRVERTGATASLEYVAAQEADTQDDPVVLRASDERALRMAQELAEARARRRDYGGARQAIHDVIGRLHDSQLALFAHDVLLPCYTDPDGYLNQSSIRASSLTLLQGRRTHSVDHRVASLLRRKEATAAELEMERLFRKKSSSKKDPSRD